MEAAIQKQAVRECCLDGADFTQQKDARNVAELVLALPDSSMPRVVQAVAVVQRAMRRAEPAEVMEDLGFGPLHLIASFPVSMSGAPPLPLFPLTHPCQH